MLWYCRLYFEVYSYLSPHLYPYPGYCLYLRLIPYSNLHLNFFVMSHRFSVDESISTLKFADRAKQVGMTDSSVYFRYDIYQQICALYCQISSFLIFHLVQHDCCSKLLIIFHPSPSSSSAIISTSYTFSLSISGHGCSKSERDAACRSSFSSKTFEVRTLFRSLNS